MLLSLSDTCDVYVSVEALAFFDSQIKVVKIWIQTVFRLLKVCALLLLCHHTNSVNKQTHMWVPAAACGARSLKNRNHLNKQKKKWACSPVCHTPLASSCQVWSSVCPVQLFSWFVSDPFLSNQLSPDMICFISELLRISGFHDSRCGTKVCGGVKKTFQARGRHAGLWCLSCGSEPSHVILCPSSLFSNAGSAICASRTYVVFCAMIWRITEGF